MAMQNPFRSEADAYRFLLIGVAYFAAIVAAKLLFGMWVALLRLRSPLGRRGVLDPSRRQARGSHAHLGAAAPGGRAPHPRDRERDRRRRGAAGCDRAARRGRQRGCSRRLSGAELTVVRHWTSDEDTARAAAQERLDRSLARLNSLGIAASRRVGDGEPLQAIEDAVRTFGPDEIVISTHPVGRSHWLEKGVVSGARERFDVPITHVVVDLVAERDDAG